MATSPVPPHRQRVIDAENALKNKSAAAAAAKAKAAADKARSEQKSRWDFERERDWARYSKGRTPQFSPQGQTAPTKPSPRSVPGSKYNTPKRATASGSKPKPSRPKKPGKYEYMKKSPFSGEAGVLDRAKRRYNIKQLKSIKGAAARRAFRTRTKLFKGKYYGPDVFKGDEALNKAWRKSGKKGNAGTFAARYHRGQVK